MARRTAPPPARPLRPVALSAAGLALGGAVTAGVILSGSPQAGAALPPGALADAVLVQLTNQNVPAINLSAYRGTYGRAVSTAEGQSDNGDFTDPDGMLNRMTISTMTNRTDAQSAKHYAQSQLTGLVLQLNSKDLVRLAPSAGSVGSMDSYAECVPPPVGPWALAYNRTDAELITVLGQKVGLGTTRLQITGSDLGVATIGPSRLTVTVTQHQDPAVQSQQYTAEAWLDITVDGTLNNLSGSQVYDGRITALRLGEVEVTCRATTPSPSPSDTGTGSPSPSPSPSDSASGSPSPSPSGSASPSPSHSPTGSRSPWPSPTGSRSPWPSHSPSGSRSPSPTKSHTVTPTPSPTKSSSPSASASASRSRSAHPAPSASGGTLPKTGSGPVGVQAALAGGLVLLGAAAVMFARRRTGRTGRH
ncbi:hypothetical protein ACGFX4_03830 [Kitasatospora sp. NPDC048365]|uniref:hypothetical protein n=1 Tax=Kitasatospora sp. NPDC048365 TaxID=3364050 RepID=UPI00371FF109